MSAQLSGVQDSTPEEQEATGAEGSAAATSHEPSGMRVTPEVTLFVGGAILSVGLIAVMLVFWRKIARQEALADAERKRLRTSARADGNVRADTNIQSDPSARTDASAGGNP